MTVREYNDLVKQVSHLSHQEKVDLLAEIANQLRADSRPERKRNIMELEGLGQEIWVGIDAQEYVNRERYSWDNATL